ncbi:hypothetical protein SAMN05660653_02497 [Desulfonatronum thiosulfatophilum]|uniref:Uncharacterized protein n=1 Tax=Desulfonatronum thiosulfatophilum TaxID=617002 RepID=A0A1G6E049_9BACT|nr:hypothetical protein SAMN05660653_02497 [Desulfonatronum thiosulfatophilum]
MSCRACLFRIIPYRPNRLPAPAKIFFGPGGCRSDMIQRRNFVFPGLPILPDSQTTPLASFPIPPNTKTSLDSAPNDIILQTCEINP